MQVWIVEATEPLPVLDGAFRDLRCGMLSKALVAQGHEVIWWTSTFNHEKKKHRFDTARTINLQTGLQLRLLHGPGYDRNNSPLRLWHHRVVADSFARAAAVAPVKPDVVFCCLPTIELSEKAVAYGEEISVPVIVDVRDLWPDLYLTMFPPRLRSLARRVLAPEFRRVTRIFRAAAGITAVSRTFLDWALAHAKRSRQDTDGVFPLGYPTQITDSDAIDAQVTRLQTEYGIGCNTLVVTFAGTFGASYDLETVIQVARVLQSSDISSKIKLIVAGDGDNGVRLREMARGLQNVVFTGWLDQNSILALLRLSSVGLAAYTEEALQSLPNKPFEYMAAGLPLLSSLRGELAALIRDEEIGIQYPPGDVFALIEGIRWFLFHPDTRLAMGLRARRLFEERFSAEVVYPRLIQHLEKIASLPDTK